MYRFKAKLVSTQEVVAQANSLEEIEGLILGFRRKQKYDEHTRANEKIQIIHVERDSLKGKHKSKEEILKVV